MVRYTFTQSSSIRDRKFKNRTKLRPSFGRHQIRGTLASFVLQLLAQRIVIPIAQNRTNLRMTGSSGAMQSRIAVIIGQLNSSTVYQQQADDLDSAGRGGPMQRCDGACRGLSVHIGAGGQQQPAGVRMPVAGGVVERRVAKVVTPVGLAARDALAQSFGVVVEG